MPGLTDASNTRGLDRHDDQTFSQTSSVLPTGRTDAPCSHPALLVLLSLAPPTPAAVPSGLARVPRDWRERYGAEVRDMLGSSKTPVVDRFDLVRATMRCRLTDVIEEKV
ncbi:MAG: hypothetical protein H0U22_10465 [Geodermatophilaceae bacterium]|nr:hypothetical protein [Geodermatophilaceae bacterium]